MAKQKIKVGLLNVQSGVGTTKGYYQYLLHCFKNFFPHDSRKIKELGGLAKKRGIDILATTEIDQGSRRTKNIDQVQLLSDSSGLVYKKFFPTFSFGARINQGNAVHSRFPILETYNYRLPGAGEPRYAGNIKIKVNGKTINFFITHLSLKAPFRKMQIKELSSHVNEFKGPTILAGDFNVSHEGELDLLEETHLKKVYSGKTYPSWRPARRLDYIFASQKVVIENGEVLSNRLSDHLLLTVDLLI